MTQKQREEKLDATKELGGTNLPTPTHCGALS